MQTFKSLGKDIIQHNSSTLLVQHHMGIGDHIGLVGMVRYAVNDLQFRKAIVFCKDQNYDLVNRLYAKDKYISVVSVGKPMSSPEETNVVMEYGKQSDEPCVYFRLGYENYPYGQCSTIGVPSYTFYDLAQVRRDVKWSHFQFDRKEEEQQRVYDKLNPGNEPYIFIHDDPNRLEKYIITDEQAKATAGRDHDLLVIRNDMSENVLDFAMILENAEEIHCMGSSMFCFADLLEIDHAKCFYYNFRPLFIRPEILDEDTRQDWIWIP